MLLALLLAPLLLACVGAPDGDAAGGDGGGDPAGDGGGDPAGDGGGTLAPEGPDLEVDVLVIGSGPAGLSAAWEASAAGASVLLLERDEVLGGGGNHARNLIAAGTRWQAEAGIRDTPDQLLLEWATITSGGDPEDPWVQSLAFESAAILDWLVDELGAEFLGLIVDSGSGTTMRLHQVGFGTYGPAQPLIEALEPLAWTQVEATALREAPEEPGRVAGAFAVDLVTGEEVEIAATATVIATGGFARDLDRVLDSRPELEGATIVFEARPGTDGGGHPLLEQVGAAVQNAAQHGLYLHATADPRPSLAGEAVVLDRLEATVMVDQDGRRVANEATASGFSLVAALASAPDRRLWAIYPAGVFDSSIPMTMGVALGIAPEEALSTSDLVDLGVASRVVDGAAAAVAVGIDEEGLADTLARYAELVALGEDLDFGKRADAMVALEGELVVVELAAGSAKSFGGAWLDAGGRVLDAAGAPIPGLLAAGEVAGMLGTPAVGVGFSGSVTACYLTGRVAGRTAATDSLAR